MSEQGSESWLQERSGRLTASRFKDVLAVGKRDGKPLEARIKYMHELAFERLSGKAKQSVSSQSMAWGTEAEPLARELYELRTGAFVTETGLIVHGEYDFIGGSPDGLVDDDGLIEIKSPFNEAVHIKTWLEGMPDEHMPQVQGNIWISGRDWCDFLSYDPRQADKLRLYRQRIYRDDAFIEDMKQKLLDFNAELEAMIGEIQSKAA